MPWHLPADLRFFKRTTLGHVVVMGRRTFDSIFDSIGRPLPQRENVVLTHREMDPIPGVRMVSSLDEIPRHMEDGREVFLLGGGQLYAALLPECAGLLLTEIDREVDGDTYFPEFSHLFTPVETLETGADYTIRRYVPKNGR